MRGCPLSLTIREMQVRTTWDITSHPKDNSWYTRNSKQNQPGITSAGKGTEKLQLSHTVNRNGKWFNCSGEQYGGPSKVKQRIIIWPSNSTSSHIPKRTEQYLNHCSWEHYLQYSKSGTMGKQWEQWESSFFGAPKSLQMVTSATKLKDACSLEEELWPT